MAEPKRNRRSDGDAAGPSLIAPELNIEHLIRLKRIDAIDANVRIFIKYGFLLAISYCCVLVVRALAGKYTFADIGVGFLADIKIVNSIGYVVGGGGVIYGRFQKKLRGDTIQKMGAHIKNLETRVDPGRGSSGLTDRGGTNPEDE